MSVEKDKPVLVDEKLALSLFLDSLLREPVEALVIESELQTKVETETEIKIPVAAPVTETELVTPVVEDVALASSRPVLEKEETETDSGCSDEFQVMLFKVAGLTLAVPLDGLNGVVEWNDDLAEMPGHAEFYLGILQHLGQRIPVVETASLVFPPDKLKLLAVAEPRERITRIVLIDEGRWGLAVDSVEEVVTLQHDEVRWRSERTQRKWLLGTVVEHMCALIDPAAFAEKLISGED